MLASKPFLLNRNSGKNSGMLKPLESSACGKPHRRRGSSWAQSYFISRHHLPYARVNKLINLLVFIQLLILDKIKFNISDSKFSGSLVFRR